MSAVGTPRARTPLTGYVLSNRGSAIRRPRLRSEYVRPTKAAKALMAKAAEDSAEQNEVSHPFQSEAPRRRPWLDRPGRCEPDRR